MKRIYFIQFLLTLALIKLTLISEVCAQEKNDEYPIEDLIYFIKGDFDEAIKKFTNKINENPKDWMAYKYRAGAYISKQLYDLAISDLTKAIEMNPSFADAYGLRGFIYTKKGLYDQSIADYNKSISINPKDAQIYNCRGIAYTQSELYNQAIDDYTRSIEIDPYDTFPYKNRGLLYMAKKLYDLAIADYTKVIEINPKDLESYNNRGLVYAEKGLIEEAIMDYNKAIELNSNYANAYYNRGLAYHYGKKLYDQAISDYSKAIEKDATYPGSYHNRGVAYYMKGLYSHAIADYTSAIKIEPEGAENYNKRAFAYATIGEYNKAWEDVHKVEELGGSINSEFIEQLKKLSMKTHDNAIGYKSKYQFEDYEWGDNIENIKKKLDTKNTKYELGLSTDGLIVNPLVYLICEGDFLGYRCTIYFGFGPKNDKLSHVMLKLPFDAKDKIKDYLINTYGRETFATIDLVSPREDFQWGETGKDMILMNIDSVKKRVELYYYSEKYHLYKSEEILEK